MAEQTGPGGDPSYESDFYSRLLPERERPIEALGGVLNGLGAGLGIIAAFVMPVLLGVTAMALTSASLGMARSRDTFSRFGIGFAISVVGWLWGMTYALIAGGDLWP